MPRYTFTFKKDDIFVDFTTEDKDVVERQFQIWVTAADNYVRSQETGNKKQGKEKSEQQIENSKEEANIPENTPEIPSTIQSFDNSTKEEPVIDKASTLLRTINSIQNEQVETEETTNEEPLASEVEANPPTIQQSNPQEGFEAVLEKTIENPTFEPDKIKDQIFLNLIKSKNTNDKFHYLIITAYYLSEFEKLERFSLKQINAKLMQNLSEVIDHTTLQEALMQNLLELVPDLTGVSEVGEYKLTRFGEEFFANKIG
jgi:hypothetical protein